MFKVAITATLALGLGLAGATASHAAVGALPAGLQAAAAPLDTVQRTEAVVRGARVAPRAVVVSPRVVGPRVVAPRALVGPRAVVVGRPVVGRAAFVRPYVPYYRRPWFGTVVAGVALGTIVAVSVAGAAPVAAPGPNLCWYWADPSMTQGFWDYCQAPY